MATGDEPRVAPDPPAREAAPPLPRRTDGADVGCIALAALAMWMGVATIVAALPLLGAGGPSAWHVGFGRTSQIVLGVVMVLLGGLVAVLAFGPLGQLVGDALRGWRERRGRR